VHPSTPTIQRTLSGIGKHVSAQPPSSTSKPQDEILVNNVQTTQDDVQIVLEKNRKNKSNRRGAPPKIEKHYLKDYNAIPGLTYVNITLSSPDHTFAEAKTHILALHCSGCAKSIIHQKVLNELLKHGHIEIMQPERPTVIISYSGEVQPVTGTANIIFHFEGINNVHKSFQLNVLVHKILLGRDFTGSDARAFEINHFLFLTDEPDIYLQTVQSALKQGDLCQVPIMSSSPSPMHVASNHVSIIAPFSNANIIGTIVKDPNKQYQLPLAVNKLTQYVIKNCTQPGLSSLPWLMDYVRPNEVCIPVHNNTPYDMIIERNTLIADIELLKEDNEYEIHFMSMNELSPDIIECHLARPAFYDPDVIECNFVKPKLIQDDEGMNDEEKDEAFLHYMKYGYHHPSMTNEVEENAALTELKLHKDVPLNDEDFDTKFDLAHLPFKNRRWA